MSHDFSVSRTPQRRRSGIHGLKMHTLSGEIANEKGQHQSLRAIQSQEEEDLDDEYVRVGAHQSSFETDEDFKFKRRRRKNGNLGERLDALQNLEHARWMDNFNSSAQGLPGGAPSSGTASKETLGGGGALTATTFAPPPGMMPPPQYMPYMYYYPMPPPQMIPIPTSPQRAENSNPSSSFQGYPNTSTQPFMPPFGHSMIYPQQQFYQAPNQPLNPVSNSSHRDPRYVHDRRRSILSQRGRRLSLLQNIQNADPLRSEIVSPHKDVPASDFYRHISNTPFGRSLRIRQLFTWCLIRCLRKLEESQDKPLYANPKLISMTIIKEFVHDLRKGKIDMDWDSTTIRQDEQLEEGEKDPDDTADTALRELFNDEDHDSIPKLKSHDRKKPLRHLHENKIMVPNEKNIQNSENAKTLERRISKLKHEIEEWTYELQKKEHRSSGIKKASIPTNINEDVEAELGIGISFPGSTCTKSCTNPQLSMDLIRRLDTFTDSTHLLFSHATILHSAATTKTKNIEKTLASASRSLPIEPNRKILSALATSINIQKTHPLPSSSFPSLN